MQLPELPESTWSQTEDVSHKTSGELIREMAARGDLKMRVPQPPAHLMRKRAAEDHLERTFAELYRLAGAHRAERLSLEEFGRRALALLPPR